MEPSYKDLCEAVNMLLRGRKRIKAANRRLYKPLANLSKWDYQTIFKHTDKELDLATRYHQRAEQLIEELCVVLEIAPPVPQPETTSHF
jgi:hypothetical protein